MPASETAPNREGWRHRCRWSGMVGMWKQKNGIACCHRSGYQTRLRMFKGRHWCALIGTHHKQTRLPCEIADALKGGYSLYWLKPCQPWLTLDWDWAHQQCRFEATGCIHRDLLLKDKKIYQPTPTVYPIELRRRFWTADFRDPSHIGGKREQAPASRRWI